MSMIHRWDFQSGAKFSPCRVWRYSLWRIWDHEKPKAVFIGLNPSTADEQKNDPTIRRCIGFCKEWGYGSYYMLNLFGFRATDPKDMKSHKNPIGEGNDKEIRRISNRGDLIVACWGANGGHLNRDLTVLKILKDDDLDVYCLGVTKNGYAKHPLYLSGDEVPVRYAGRIAK